MAMVRNSARALSSHVAPLFARSCSFPLYRRPGPLPPNILAGRVTTWRRGERWVHDKGLVHGRGPRQGAASPKLEKQPTSQDGGLELQELVVSPTVTFSLERSGRRSPYHQSGNSCRPFAWCSVAGCFIHENGNCGAVITTRRHAHDSAVGVEPMCALSRRQSFLRGEGNPPRG